MRFPVTETTIEYPGGKRKIKHFNTPLDNSSIAWMFTNANYPIFTLTQTPKSILDIGANVGDAAIMFHLQYPEARIDCFEPNPEAFALLLENTADIPQIACHNVAVGDKPGMAYVVHNPMATVMDFTTERKPGDDREYTEIPIVPALPLLPCDILKVDVEGGEYNIFKSMVDCLAQIPIIYVETHNNLSRMTIDQMLGHTHALLHCAVASSDQVESAYVRMEWLDVKEFKGSQRVRDTRYMTYHV